MSQRGPFPHTRLRRLRATAFARNMVRESTLSPADFIYPVFVLEGNGQREAVPSMPGVERLSVDLLVELAKEADSLGIPALALFPVIGQADKSLLGEAAYAEDGLVQRAVAELKSAVPALGIITDVALDPYTTHGQEVQDIDSTTFYNMSEVEEIVTRVSELYDNWPKEWGERRADVIGVLSPYGEQVHSQH